MADSSSMLLGDAPAYQDGKREAQTHGMAHLMGRALCYFYLFVMECGRLKWRRLMCEWRAEDARKDKRVPIQLSPLTEATDAIQFTPKNIIFNFIFYFIFIF